MRRLRLSLPPRGRREVFPLGFIAPWASLAFAVCGLAGQGGRGRRAWAVSPRAVRRARGSDLAHMALSSQHRDGVVGRNGSPIAP